MYITFARRKRGWGATLEGVGEMAVFDRERYLDRSLRSRLGMVAREWQRPRVLS
jgi:hypothetical protein